MEVLAIIVFVAVVLIKQLAAAEEEREEKETTDLPDIASAPVADEMMRKGGKLPGEPDAAREWKKPLSAAEDRESFEKRNTALQTVEQKIRQAQIKRNADERESSVKRWEAARRKQADRSEVHSIHMDSCEDRLESVKVLYEAGILDREEYQQRVRRIKKAHALSKE